MNTKANTHSRCPHASSSVETGSTASFSSATTTVDVNINAVDIYQPMGYSPIPTDICLVGVDDDSVDEFDSPEQSPIYDTDDPPPEHAIAFDDTPCEIVDPYNWDGSSPRLFFFVRVLVVLVVVIVFFFAL